MQIGSEAHKELFCRTFFEGHKPYEPEHLPWPDLEGEPLALMRSLPFWTHALQAEEDAGPMISACAALEPDPRIREALELQAFEETRHARIINHMIALYDLKAGDVHVDLPADVVEGFIDFGFEECLDSFGAFGLFALARQSRLVPDPLFAIFDQVMQEEAFHIVFFINWFAHRQANLGLATRAMRGPKSLWHYGKALRKIGDLLRDDDSEEGADFIVTGAESFVDHLTPKLVVRTCLEENERRLAGFDRRLLIPRLIPRLARMAWTGLRWIPERGEAPGPNGSAPASSDRTSRAA